MSRHSPMLAPLRAWRKNQRLMKAYRYMGETAKKHEAQGHEVRFVAVNESLLVLECLTCHPHRAPQPPKREREHVVAYNYQHAVRYARDNGLRHGDWTYVDRPARLRGTRNPKVIFLGWPSAWSLEDREEYEMNLRLAWRG